MSEVLYRRADKINRNNPMFDAQCSKRGDIVVVVDDGWSWGSLEIQDPEKGILKLPQIPKEQIMYLAQTELVDPLLNPYWQKRSHGILMDDFPRGLLITEDEKNHIYRAEITYAQAQAYIKFKQPLNDPNVF